MFFSVFLERQRVNERMLYIFHNTQVSHSHLLELSPHHFSFIIISLFFLRIRITPPFRVSLRELCVCASEVKEQNIVSRINFSVFIRECYISNIHEMMYESNKQPLFSFLYLSSSDMRSFIFFFFPALMTLLNFFAPPFHTAVAAASTELYDYNNESA